MHTTNLRKAGGSVMLAVPPLLLEPLNLNAGSTVGVSFENGRLLVEARPRPRYAMAELLAAPDYSQSRTPEDREWIDAPAARREPLLSEAISIS
jgi:antitoxin ChpS